MSYMQCQAPSQKQRVLKPVWASKIMKADARSHRSGARSLADQEMHAHAVGVCLSRSYLWATWAQEAHVESSQVGLKLAR